MSRFRGLGRHVGLALALLFLLALVLPLEGRSGRDARVGDDRLGVHTIRPNGRTMSLARDAGFRWVVQVISWREVETWKGQFSWEFPDAVVRAASFYDLNLILRVDQQPHWSSAKQTNAPPDNLNDYGDFLAALARRYKGKVKAYIVWNEPNLALEWGDEPPDPAAYAALLKVAYESLKAVDPQTIVVSAGLAPTNERSPLAMDDRIYLRLLYEAGAQGYFDVLGAHPYGFAHPPDDPRGAHDDLNFRRVMDLREIMVEKGDGEKEVWATEFGWPLGTDNPKDEWKVVGEKEQATYLSGAITQARREWPWMGVMAVWNLSAELPPSNDGRWYSLVGDDYSPRPSFFALQSLGRKAMLRN